MESADRVDEMREAGVLRNGQELEVTLYTGVKFDTAESDIPCAHGRSKASEKPGNTAMGHVVRVRGRCFSLVQDWDPRRGRQVQFGRLCGCTIYGDAIHSYKRLVPEQP